MKQQKGMTFLGYVLVLGIIGFFAIMAMKLTPLYLEYQSVNNVMQGITKEPQTITPQALRSTIGKRLNVNNVNRVEAKDFKIRREKGRLVVSIAYNAETKFVGNLFFLVKFENEVEITGP
ncbi:MAG: DUF4845 domain-containing protein [Gammaproteobacteria bacterium]|nr:DUF4845 domain-containing protein [Gammaproteobacteria bacterium]